MVLHWPNQGWLPVAKTWRGCPTDLTLKPFNKLTWAQMAQGGGWTADLLMVWDDLVTLCTYLCRTATSWIRVGPRSLCGKGRKPAKLRDMLQWPEFWWVLQTVTCILSLSLMTFTWISNHLVIIGQTNWKIAILDCIRFRHHHSQLQHFIIFLLMAAAGVYQSQRLPTQHKRGDSDWRGRVISLQAAVPDVDSEGRDAGSGQNAHARESGYVEKNRPQNRPKVSKTCFFSMMTKYICFSSHQTGKVWRLSDACDARGRCTGANGGQWQRPGGGICLLSISAIWSDSEWHQVLPYVCVLIHMGHHATNATLTCVIWYMVKYLVERNMLTCKWPHLLSIYHFLILLSFVDARCSFTFWMCPGVEDRESGARPSGP